ncbi:phosphatase PAP2 family protein [Micromonospora sp. CA-249363]|uniref:phosphatase PAP2 family protein n=1 Tax=Micromonospora sp. CA-249363 TaxID=3239963 RepID=UPI003D903A4C
MSHGSSYPVGRPSSTTRTLPHALTHDRPAVPPALRLLAAGVCCLLALGLVGVVFVWTQPGQWIDGLLLPRAERGGGYAQPGGLFGPATVVLRYFGQPALLAVLLTAVLVVGLHGRRLLPGVVGVGTVLAAVLAAGAAKSALPRPELAVADSTTHNSFPSGHVAVATALALAFLLVAPGAARRWLVVPAAAGVSVIGAATMIAGWHRFSDVLGGVLLSLALFCLAAAALAARSGGDALRPSGGPTSGRVRRALVEGAVGVAVLVWAVRVLVPGLAAELRSGPLLAVLMAAALTMLAVGVAVFLIRPVEFVQPGRTGAPAGRQRPRNIDRYETYS